MKIKIDTSGLGQSKWFEYLLRFVFGGAVTAFAGIVAKQCGPVIGGLFLAFPAIFPASATLIDKHEKERKEQAGLNGVTRGRSAAGVDAAGAAMGSIGLIAFALVVWRYLPHSSTAIVLASATTLWLITSVSVWELREKLCRRWAFRRSRRSHQVHPVQHRSLSTIRRHDE